MTICDCELGHNGFGMAGRECDCEERKLAQIIEDLIKAAPGIDFYLNERIAAATGWTLVDAVECLWRSPDGQVSQPPLYTSSVDAALTLVPDEHDWILEHTNGGMTICAYVGGIGDECRMFGDSPALALAASALAAKIRNG